MPEPEIRIPIRTEADLKAVKEAQKTFGDFAREIPGVGRAIDLLKNPIALVTAGVAGLGTVVRSLASAFSGAQEQSARLDQALANAGLLTDAYREKLAALSAQLEETTSIADDRWTAVIRKLTQQGADETTIDSAVEAVKNLAGITGDVESAADAIGRAMNGHFELFSRMGIEAKELNALYLELALKGGGQLEARNKTLTGQSDTLANAWDNLKEAAGGVVAQTGVLQESAAALTRFLNGLNSAIGETIPQLEGLRNATSHSLGDQRELAVITREQAEATIALKTALEDVNKQYEAQRGLQRELMGDQERELGAEKDAVLADLEASNLSAPEKARARFAIEQSFNARGRALRDQGVAGEVFGLHGEAQASAQAVAGMQRKLKAAQARLASAPDQDAARKEIESINAELAPDEEFIASIRAGMGDNPVGDELKRGMIADVEARMAPKIARRSALLRAGTQYSADKQTVKELTELLPGAITERDADIARFRASEGAAIRGFDSRQRVDAFADQAGARRAQASAQAGFDQAQSALADAITTGRGSVESLTRMVNEWQRTLEQVKRTADDAARHAANLRDR